MLLEPQKPLKQDLYQTFGDSGTKRYSGYFTEEPQFKWRDQDRIDNVETMRRTDATVKQFLTAIKTPMLATEYSIEAAGEDSIMVEQADLVRDSLFGMDRSFRDFMRELLTYLDFGFSVFEIIYAVKNGRIVIKDLQPRIQSSIQNWQLSDGRKGVVQWIMTDEVNKTTAEIPMNKLLVITNDKEGDDITGQSVLRPCWKHFQIKDRAYRVSAISFERYGVGIPVVTLPDGATDQQKEDAENLAANIRSNEKGYIVLPSKDWVIDILVPKGNPQQSTVDSQINHHDRMILMAGLAGFLNLGSDSTGSYALSKDQSSFFLKHCEDKLLYICEQIGKQIIERLIDLNYGKQEKYPKLTFTPLGDIDFGEYSGVINTLNQGGLLSNLKPRDYQFIRKTFKMPMLTDEELMEMEQSKIDEELAALEQSANEDANIDGEDNMGMFGDDNTEDDNTEVEDDDSADITDKDL